MEKTAEKNRLRSLVFPVLFVILSLHPVIELDYLIGEIIPVRLTTVIDFLVLPLAVLIVFFLFEKKKDKVLKVFIPYLIFFGVYYLLHCRNAGELQYKLYLPENWYFSFWDETIYTLTLMIPLVYIYVFYKAEIKEEFVKRITVTSSCVTALPIFISNLFVFGRSTYQGYTIANFLTWFSLPFDEEMYHPRKYATKFFFEEGNTIGILMLMVLPFLYYFLLRSKDKKEKAGLGILIMIHSLSMIILSTRVATYGSALVPVAVFMILFILSLLKIEKRDIRFMIYTVVMAVLCTVVIPYGPAYQNQQIDAMDYGVLIETDSVRTDARDNVKRQGENLVPYSEEWFNYYTYVFEDLAINANLLGVTPPIYYTDWYDYHHDPQFWVDLMLDYELEQRVSGRQIENIFTRYKYDPLDAKEKALGMGFGTFMRGGIVIEQDFKQQFFSYGPIGFVLIMLPWIVIALFLAVKLILGYKKQKWQMINILFMMAICMGLGASYLSGHVIDELTTSLFISFCCAGLWQRLAHE